MNGKVVVTPPTQIFEEGEEIWKSVVVAQFIGQVPKFSLFQKLVKIMWGSNGSAKVKPARANSSLYSSLMKK
ncbi:hypothetical protein DITRI_Ditri03aG0011700 [Diplodiscus trichospermus]